jgi:hypothetical protein
MGVAWIIQKQSVLYTTVKVRAEKELKTKYPDIRFTMDDTAQLQSQFPTVYVHYLQGRELARDVEGDAVNAFSCDVQIDVTVSKAQGKTVAEEVVSEVAEEFKKLRFNMRGTPVFVSTGNETKQLSFRMNRAIGSDDE